MVDPIRGRRVRRRVKMALRRKGLCPCPEAERPDWGLGQFSFGAMGGTPSAAAGFGSVLGGIANVGVGIWDKIESGKLQKEQIKATRDVEIAKANAQAAAASAQAQLAAAGFGRGGSQLSLPLILGGVGVLGLVAVLALRK